VSSLFAVGVFALSAGTTVALVPLALRLPPDRTGAGRSERALQALLLAGTVAAVLSPVQHLPVAMLPLAALVWAAARLGLRTAAVQLALTGMVALTATTRGWGPYATSSGPEAADAAVQAALVHLFVLVTGVVTLALAAATDERVEALQHAADLALHDGLTGLANRRRQRPAPADKAGRRSARVIVRPRAGELSQRLTTSS
jgi:integral membrane sensor domain MASE1